MRKTPLCRFRSASSALAVFCAHGRLRVSRIRGVRSDQRAHRRLGYRKRRSAVCKDWPFLRRLFGLFSRMPYAAQAIVIVNHIPGSPSI